MYSVLTILILIAMVYISVIGFNSAIFKIHYGIGALQGTYSVTFLTLSAVVVTIIIADIIAIIALQVASGARFLGAGVGQVGGVVILLMYQVIPMTTIFTFLTAVDAVPMAQIPFGLGIIVLAIMGIYFMVSLIMHVVGAGS